MCSWELEEISQFSFLLFIELPFSKLGFGRSPELNVRLDSST